MYFTAIVGLEVCIIFHPSRSLRGLCGRIVRETRNYIVLETKNNRRLQISKKGGLFLFKLGENQCFLVRGEEISGTLAERLKRLERGKGVTRLVRTSKKRWNPGCKTAGESV